MLTQTRLALTALFIFNLPAHADTIDHYMNIANNIPQMELKADRASQAWAHSSRTVLTLACDSIADSLLVANEIAIKMKHPLFCLPQGMQLTSTLLDELIQQSYNSNPQIKNAKTPPTVSTVALNALEQHYPCK